jgi:deglycase
MAWSPIWLWPPDSSEEVSAARPAARINKRPDTKEIPVPKQAGNTLKDKKVAFIVANEGVEQAELTGPWEAVEKAGGHPVLLATKAGKVQCFNHLDKADVFEAEKATSDMDVDSFDALVLPGGVANADQLRADPDAVSAVRRFFDTGRPVAVICHGPWSIVEADRVRNRTMTSWPSLQTDIRNAGGTWVDRQVQVCDSGPNILVSSRKPDDLDAFNREMIKAFAQPRRQGPPGSYADPQDLQFGAAARDKEERLDAALQNGEGIPADEPAHKRPRAGAKANPR